MNNVTTIVVNDTRCVLIKESNEYLKDIFKEKRAFTSIFPFLAPFRLIVAGPSQSGKTTFVKRLIHHSNVMIRPPPSSITWFYMEEQSWFPELSNRVNFEKGHPVISTGITNQLIIIDDQFQDISKEIVNLFTVSSHHKGISIILITQNFFHKSANLRNCSLNATHVAFFKNPRDKLQISYLAREMSPDKPKFVASAYDDATKNPYSYLLLDYSQETKDQYRVRTNIFPGEFPRIYRAKP